MGLIFVGMMMNFHVWKICSMSAGVRLVRGVDKIRKVALLSVVYRKTKSNVVRLLLLPTTVTISARM